MDKTRLETILEGFKKSRIMVVGDIMLDEYLEGTVDRISPEAPIPVVNLSNRSRRDIRLGGAANVFNNLISLGAGKVYLCGVVGADPDGSPAADRHPGSRGAFTGSSLRYRFCPPGKPQRVRRGGAGQLHITQ